MEIIRGFLIINGEKKFESNEELDIENPATEELIGKIPKVNPEDLQRSIEAAKKAFPEWSQKNPSKRCEILKKVAGKIKDRAKEIAEILTLEQGKPFNEALEEILTSANIIDYYAEESKRIKGVNYWINDNNIKSQVIYQPIGIIAAITPFNYPVSLTAFKVGPALAAGNTVIVKPSSKTPLSVNKFLECFLSSDLPGGALNFIVGNGSMLVKSPHIGKVSFTGSTNTGKEIAASCGNSIKRTTLELGGNCPLIVFADSDIKKAAIDCTYRAFRNMGQVCNSVNRVYIEEPVFNEFKKMFISETKKLVIGNGMENPDADLGPMVSGDEVKKVLEHIEDAKQKGANVEYGGKTPDGFKRGFFLEPTILSNVSHDMKVMKEETFGPVTPLMSFTNTDEVINLANDSSNGLVAYAYTGDYKRAILLAEKLQFGTVGINNVSGAEVGYPYGGWKESGIGVEVSEHALYEYQNLKHIRIKL